MTISIGMILGAILAIAIVYIIVRALLAGAAAMGVPLHPVVTIIAWAFCAVFACVAIAWAFGVEIPFVNISG